RKRSFTSRAAIPARIPGYNLHIQTHLFPAQMSSFWKQISFIHTEDFGKALNLFVRHDTASRFDIG
ncbi:MAG TPA: hypothetical protein VH595_16505, partial [Verrucomicrobiae bacterium]|nr:hypothetical protein [Verrucomicrobiae bacterium]